MTELVAVKNLRKNFGFKPALAGVGLTLETGRIIGLMGPNGAGKTTLLNIIAGVLPADGGEVRVCGEMVSADTRRWTSYAPDQQMIHRWMRGTDAIAYYADMFADFDPARASDLAESLRIDLKAKIRQLSFGEQERVNVMLTLARKARLYLLDEPFTGIDPLAKDKILKAVMASVTEESSAIISTHQVKDVETMIDDVIFLQRGQVKMASSAEEIRESKRLSIEECYLQEYEND
jgi:ABC-2 type transport system ATP-binding protein